MYTRVVRFTNVDKDRIKDMQARIEASDGPPEGVKATGLTVLLDEGQGTAIVLQRFATEADMEAGAQIFAAMDAGETPGTRASVDMCELILQREMQDA